MRDNKGQRKLVFGLVIALILVIFACLNINPVTINFGFFKPKMPLIIVLIVMMLLGAVVSLLMGAGEGNKSDKLIIQKNKAELEKKYKKLIDQKDQKIKELEEQLDTERAKNSESSNDDKD